MDHIEASEIVAGKLLRGDLEADRVNPIKLTTPYDTIAIQLTKDASRAELIERVGINMLRAAENAVDKNDGISNDDALELLHTFAARTEAGAALGPIAERLARGELVDVKQVAELLKPLSEDGHSLESLTWDEYYEDVPDQSWVWWPWVPRGELTVVLGPEEVGKSSFVLTLCDIIGQGTKLPDGTLPGMTGKTVWVETEGRSRENKNRTATWNIDRRNFLHPPLRHRGPARLADPDDWAAIERAASKPRVVCVVVDSLGWALSNEKDEQVVKPLMQKLASLAESLNIAVMVIHHPRKADAKLREDPAVMTLERARGHGSITQISPAVIAVERPDPDQKRRNVRMEKCNFEEKPKAFGFDILAGGLEFTDPLPMPVHKSKPEQAAELWKLRLQNGRQPLAETELAIMAEVDCGKSSSDTGRKMAKVKTYRDGIHWAEIR